MSNSSYGPGLGNDLQDEQGRLAAVEMLFDPGTMRHIDALGIDSGMRCLELGAGSGSVARYMAECVGDSGSVLATDIDISQLAGCDMPNLEVRQHDICTDALPEAAFDIIHARLLLEHLPPRLAVLEKLADALAPGGWLLIEDLDFTGWLNLPEEKLPVSPQTIRAAYQAAFLASASTGSWDGEWARDLPIHFMNLGLSRVGAEVCAPIIFGGSPQAAFVTVSIRQLVPLLVEGGYVSQADLDALIDAFERPGAMVGGYSMVSAWGTP